MGDMLMLTGTFTDGGKEVSFDGQLSTVFAAGGHLTSIFDTGVKVNAGNIAAGSTVLTVDTVDAETHFAVGQTLYNPSGVRLGVLTAVTATELTIAAPGLTVAVVNNENYFVLGANKPSITLISTSLDVSVDETNNLVIFECGNRSATSDVSTADGRWWILGQR
tara:strand:- start:1220 stop:1711 length:492 start_codon:yes stop_codon:yes gene_type:complete